MRIGLTVWIMVAVLSYAGAAFALESAATPPTVPSEQTIASPSARGPGKSPSLMGCRMRPYREDPMRAPFLLIEEGPIPGSDPDRSLTPAETKCVENLRKAGKKAIERGKITERIFHYLSAMDTAPGLAGPIYLDLASALDQTAYTQPAGIRARKARAPFADQAHRVAFSLDPPDPSFQEGRMVGRRQRVGPAQVEAQQVQERVSLGEVRVGVGQ